MVGRRVTLPAESTSSSVRVTKTLHRLTELTTGRLSSEFTQTVYILLHAFTNRLHNGRCATQLRQFESNFNFGSIFFLIDNARACSVNLHSAELTRECEPKCIHSKKSSQVRE